MAAISRRGFLSSAAGAAVVGLAGCTVEYNGGGGRGGGIATGTTGSGFAYDEPDATEADATHTARSADELLPAPDEASEHTWIGRTGSLCPAAAFALLFVAALPSAGDSGPSDPAARSASDCLHRVCSPSIRQGGWPATNAPSGVRTGSPAGAAAAASAPR
jgi:hypothetical protein